MTTSNIKNNPFQIYFTFGIVAAIAIAMSGFVGAGLAIWYPTLVKPVWTIPLSFTYLISIFLYVTYGTMIYRSYSIMEDIDRKWMAFFSSIVFFIFHELSNVLLYNMKSVTIHFTLDLVVLWMGISLFVFFWKNERISAYFLLPYFLFSLYNIPWSFMLMKLN